MTSPTANGWTPGLTRAREIDPDVLRVALEATRKASKDGHTPAVWLAEASGADARSWRRWLSGGALPGGVRGRLVMLVASQAVALRSRIDWSSWRGWRLRQAINDDPHRLTLLCLAAELATGDTRHARTTRAALLAVLGVEPDETAPQDGAGV